MGVVVVISDDLIICMVVTSLCVVMMSQFCDDLIMLHAAMWLRYSYCFREEHMSEVPLHPLLQQNFSFWLHLCLITGEPHRCLIWKHHHLTGSDPWQTCCLTENKTRPISNFFNPIPAHLLPLRWYTPDWGAGPGSQGAPALYGSDL